MLIKTEIFNLKQLSQQSTLTDIKLDCMNDFCYKIIKMYLTDFGKDYNSIKRYEMFRSLFAQKITLNLDNLIFQENIKITTLKNHCVQETKDLLTNYDSTQLANDEQKIVVDLTDQIKFKCNHQDLLKQLYEIAEIMEELFGKGQFPIMTLHIIKIGNINYFYYTISR